MILKKITEIKSKNLVLQNLKRVAAYTRVSDPKEAMLRSLSAQVSYYSNYIQKRKDWEYAGVYIDKITGTKEDRPEFQRLIKDALDGKIDMIIAKSVTRFARNTVTTLETVRKLKEIGVDIYFETENLHSIGPDGEFLLTLIASFAQEQSLSVSENCKWRIRNDFEKGIPNNFKVYGYSTKNGVNIISKEAEIIKMIFEDYLSGMGRTKISKKLNELKIKPMYGTLWRESVIASILKNEKYIGDLLLQKSYIKDHLSKKQIKNTGELPQYYVENNHEPIITKEFFEKVQNEINKRSKKFIKSKGNHLYTGLIKCGICGANFKHKINSKKSIWICNTFNSLGKKYCASHQIPEEILKKLVSETAKTPEIERILVPKQGTIIFCLKNGEKVIKTWKNKSRSQSWTPEMKMKAREVALCKQQQ